MIRYHSQDQRSFMMNEHFPPISRTLRYKKVTKPLLERKRRARINRCLDELKNLVGALETDGENINKLEKADILELTVRYLKRISRLQDPVQEAHRFQAGFSQCASEAFTFLLSLPGLDSVVGKRLIDHLKECISKRGLDCQLPANNPRLQNAQSLRVSLPQNSSHLTPSKSPTNVVDHAISPCRLFQPKVVSPPPAKIARKTESPPNNLRLSPKTTPLNLLQVSRTSPNSLLTSIDIEPNSSMWRPW